MCLSLSFLSRVFVVFITLFRLSFPLLLLLSNFMSWLCCCSILFCPIYCISWSCRVLFSTSLLRFLFACPFLIFFVLCAFPCLVAYDVFLYLVFLFLYCPSRFCNLISSSFVVFFVYLDLLILFYLLPLWSVLLISLFVFLFFITFYCLSLISTIMNFVQLIFTFLSVAYYRTFLVLTSVLSCYSCWSRASRIINALLSCFLLIFSYRACHSLPMLSTMVIYHFLIYIIFLSLLCLAFRCSHLAFRIPFGITIVFPILFSFSY